MESSAVTDILTQTTQDQSDPHNNSYDHGLALAFAITIPVLFFTVLLVAGCVKYYCSLRARARLQSKR